MDFRSWFGIYLWVYREQLAFLSRPNQRSRMLVSRISGLVAALWSARCLGDTAFVNNNASRMISCRQL